MNNTVTGTTGGRRPWRLFLALFLAAAFLAAVGVGPGHAPPTRAQSPVPFDPGVDPDLWYQVHEAEHAWQPDYLHLATGDPNSTDHGVYDWPYALDSIGWSIQSYQDYGGTPYFHHGLDMMKVYGTNVYNRSGGQVINIENYRPGWDLYWEVAVLDPAGYIWQYHHIDEPTIPQYIWDKWYEYQTYPITGGFILSNTYIGDIIEWPVWSFGKQFNHIHLNILGAGGVYMNGFEFHTPLPDADGPEIQGVGLLKDGQIEPGNEVEVDYSLYVRARDLVLDDVYYLPPYAVTFSVDGGPTQTTWRFDTLPGGDDRYAYLDDFYVVPPTCGDYYCRDYYIDLGFIPDSQYQFPCSRGGHTLVVTVTDYVGNLASQSYAYTVLNSPPNADPQSVSTQEDTPLAILLTGFDPNDDLLTYSLVAGPDHGLLSGTAPTLTYTPALDYHGADAFTFVVSDGLATSEPAVVDVTVQPVNDPPLAHPQTVTTTEDAPLAILLTGSDPDDDPLSFGLVAGPDHGLLSGAPPSLTYTPALDYNGSDAFTFVVSDGLATSEPAVVDVTVQPVNDPPLAVEDSYDAVQDTPLFVPAPGVLENDHDAEDDPLTAWLDQPPLSGTVALNPDGSFTYTPTAGFVGLDGFRYHASDGLAASEPAVVDVTVQPANEVPVAHPQTVTTTEDTPLAILLTGTDPDDDPLSFSLVAGPDHGLLSGTPPTLTYTPALDYHGADAFTFVVSDGLATSEPALVDVTVQPVNDPPLAVGDSYDAVQDTPLFVPAPGVLENDHDAEDDPLTAWLDQPPLSGTVALNPDGAFTYTPTAGFVGLDRFSYRASDGLADGSTGLTGASNPATVTLNLLPSPGVDLGMSKTVDHPSPYEGETVVYTLQVTNHGAADATGVWASDPLPAGLTYLADDGAGGYDPVSGAWDVGDLPVGGSASLHLSVTVDAGVAGAVITNTATITAADQNDPVPDNDRDEALVTVTEFPCTPVTAVSLSYTHTGTLYPGAAVYLMADLTPDDGTWPYSYTLDYGDGSGPVDGASSDDPFPFNHAYTATGTFTVAFWAWNCEMTGPVSDTVQVEVAGPGAYTVYLPVLFRVSSR